MRIKLIPVFKAVFYVILVGLLALLIHKNNYNVTLDLYQYKVYTSTGILTSCLVVLWFTLLKMAVFYNRIKFKIKLNIAEKDYNQRFYSPESEMEKALENGLKRDFIRLLLTNINLKTYKMYKSISHSISPQKRLRLTKKIYDRNNENAVAGLMYAEELFANEKLEQAREILVEFLDKRPTFMQKSEVVYLLSKLAIEVENKITGNLDFAQKYLDNIEAYNKNLNR